MARRVYMTKEERHKVAEEDLLSFVRKERSGAYEVVDRDRKVPGSEKNCDFIFAGEGLPPVAAEHTELALEDARSRHVHDAFITEIHHELESAGLKGFDIDVTSVGTLAMHQVSSCAMTASASLIDLISKEPQKLETFLEVPEHDVEVKLHRLPESLKDHLGRNYGRRIFPIRTWALRTALLEVIRDKRSQLQIPSHVRILCVANSWSHDIEAESVREALRLIEPDELEGIDEVVYHHGRGLIYHVYP